MKKAYLILAAAALLAGSCKKDGTEPGDNGLDHEDPTVDEKGGSWDRMEILFRWEGDEGVDFEDMFYITIPTGEGDNAVTGMNDATDIQDEFKELDKKILQGRWFFKPMGKAVKEYRFETKKKVDFLWFYVNHDDFVLEDGEQMPEYDEQDPEKALDALLDLNKTTLGGTVRFTEIGRGVSRTVRFSGYRQMVRLQSFEYEVGNPGKLRELEKHGLKVE